VGLVIGHLSSVICHLSLVIGVMKSESFENLRVYRAAEAVGDLVWEVVSVWDGFALNTIGKQFDSGGEQHRG